MAKDDFFVIVYQLLKYLYERLKNGEKPELCYLSSSIYSIPESYWEYILSCLINEQYIAGITVTQVKGGVVFGDLQSATITPKGIEFFFENSLIQKAKRTLKDVKDLMPFV